MKKPNYAMAGCKTTQHGTFKDRRDAMEALFLTLSDIVLEVGSDQKRPPKFLPDGITVDTNDATVEQYKAYLDAEDLKKLAKEKEVAAHSFSNKKRKCSSSASGGSIDEENTEDEDSDNNDGECGDGSTATFDTDDAEAIADMDDEGLISSKAKRGPLKKAFNTGNYK